MSKPAKAAGGNCPICGRPTAVSYRPFCSRRCADVDLARWLRGAYAIPGGGDDVEGREGRDRVDDGEPSGNRERGRQRH
jgi:endogenous inhibitor of DNA gyrase (YacG/DUF329 family)